LDTIVNINENTSIYSTSSNRTTNVYKYLGFGASTGSIIHGKTIVEITFRASTNETADVGLYYGVMRLLINYISN
jgi:hypothetical protein